MEVTELYEGLVELSASVALRSGSADWPTGSAVGVRTLNNRSS